MIANAQKRGLLDAMAVFYMIRASLRHSTQIWPRTKVKRPAVGSRKHAQGPQFAGRPPVAYWPACGMHGLVPVGSGCTQARRARRPHEMLFARRPLPCCSLTILPSTHVSCQLGAYSQVARRNPPTLSPRCPRPAARVSPRPHQATQPKTLAGSARAADLQLPANAPPKSEESWLKSAVSSKRS